MWTVHFLHCCCMLVSVVCYDSLHYISFIIMKLQLLNYSTLASRFSIMCYLVPDNSLT